MTAHSTRRTLTVMIAATVLAVIPAALPTLAAPALGTPAASVDRSLHLTGAPNARDITGYRGVGGAAVDALVIRSDNLSKLTTADVSVLTGRSVRSVVDLRTGLERVFSPDKRVPGAVPVTHDVLGHSPITTLIDLPSAYRAFITDAGARAAFADTLRDIERTAATGGTTLVHCTAGKDRTGWASAVLLTILGVDRATVEQDFLDSNTYRHTSSSDPVNGVNIDWLRSSFTTANAMYGSFDGYVHTGLGLTDSDIATLRAELLSPATP